LRKKLNKNYNYNKKEKNMEFKIRILTWLITVIFLTRGVYAQETLSSVTTRGNVTSQALRIGGGANIGPGTDAGIVLGVLYDPQPNDVRDFIGWKNSGNVNTTTDGLAGTLLLQARSDIPASIDFATGQGQPTLRMRISGNGNIGIGGISAPLANLDVRGNIYASTGLYVGASDVNTPTKMNGYLLAVNGNAIFNKAIVKLFANWPDYVFSPAYQLTSLDSLEQFIKVNKHLPEVPSAADVQKDGVDLGSNQVVLLKKIEELTLIVIEQNKRIEKLEADLKKK
jgi:hypothetical protein